MVKKDIELEGVLQAGIIHFLDIDSSSGCRPTGAEGMGESPKL